MRTDNPNIYRVGEHASFEGRRVAITEVIPNGLKLFYRAIDVESEREYYLRPSQLRPASAAASCWRCGGRGWIDAAVSVGYSRPAAERCPACQGGSHDPT